MNRFWIDVEYSDGSEWGFYVEMDGKGWHIVANLMMVTRGALMASNASTATCYDMEGFVVCAYRR